MLGVDGIGVGTPDADESWALDPVWLGVKPRQLAALVAVVREGSFRGAAARIGCAQSGVSQLIARLESTLGTLLIDRARGRQGLELTDAGRALARHATIVLEELEAAASEFSCGQPAEERVLRIGAGEMVGLRIMAPAIAALMGDRPGTRVLVESRSSQAEQLKSVEDGTLDAVLTDLPLSSARLVADRLWFEPWVAVVGADTPRVLSPTPVSAAEVAAFPVLFAGAAGHASLLLDGLRARGLNARISWQSELASAVVALVATGGGMAIAPSLAIDPGDDRVVTLDLDLDLMPARRIALMRRARGPHCSELEYLRELLRSAEVGSPAERVPGAPVAAVA